MPLRALALRSLLAIAVLVSAGLSTPAAAVTTSVTVAGSFQSEIGCSGDWDPTCAATHLTYDATDNVWQGAWTIPAGNWEYKAAINDSWAENYGLHATAGGANIALNLGSSTLVKFYYDDSTHWVTDNVNFRIVTAPGDFQSELGCSGDWDPSCLRSWLEDPDGDGIFTMLTTSLPAGTYGAKAAISESWVENYGIGGVAGGANIPFTVPSNNAPILFSFNSATNVLTIGVVEPGTPVPEPGSLALAAAALAMAVPMRVRRGGSPINR